MEDIQKEPTKEGIAFRFGPIIQFAIKTLIVAGVSLWSISYVLTQIEESIDSRVNQIKATLGSATGREFWTRIEKELDRLADPQNDLTPEKKQRILLQIRTVVNNWRPLVLEAVSIADANKSGR
jgi:hypothetical protein